MNLNQSIEIFVQCNFTIDDESTSLSNINDFFSSHQPKNQKCVIYIFEIISTLLQTEPSMDIDLSPIEYSYSMEKDYTDGDFTNSISIHNDRLYLFVHLSKGLCPINFIYNTNIKIKYLIFNYLSEQYSEQFKTDIAENIIDFDCKILHRLFHFLNNFSSHNYLKLSSRKSINNKEIIVNEQQNKCNCCQMFLSKNYDIDHIIELGYFGTNERNNLQALCLECHREKTRYNVNIKSKYKYYKNSPNISLEETYI